MALTRISGIGSPNPTSYTADQIVGKNLVANMRIPAYKLPYDDAKPVFYFNKDQNVGVVYSWLDVAPGRSMLWWMFKAPTGASYADSGGYYYVPHKQGYFNIQSLVDQGALTVAEATALANAAKPTLMTYINKYLPWILVTVAAVAFGKKYIDKKL